LFSRAAVVHATIDADMQVLVVEDDPDISDALCAMLADEGHATECVDSIGAATAKVTRSTYDVILLDWMLGQQTGEELLPTLVELDSVPSVILYSASPSARAVADKWSMSFLKKPFDFDELLTTLARCTTHGTSIPVRPGT
jgi:DNA-binding response OmpR family regulator